MNGISCVELHTPELYQNGAAPKVFTFAQNWKKPLADPMKPAAWANVLKMSNIEHFPAVERCIMWR
jgi:hypothetical protein